MILVDRARCEEESFESVVLPHSPWWSRSGLSIAQTTQCKLTVFSALSTGVCMASRWKAVYRASSRFPKPPHHQSHQPAALPMRGLLLLTCTASDPDFKRSHATPLSSWNRACLCSFPARGRADPLFFCDLPPPLLPRWSFLLESTEFLATSNALVAASAFLVAASEAATDFAIADSALE